MAKDSVVEGDLVSQLWMLSMIDLVATWKRRWIT